LQLDSDKNKHRKMKKLKLPEDDYYTRKNQRQVDALDFLRRLMIGGAILLVIWKLLNFLNSIA